MSPFKIAFAISFFAFSFFLRPAHAEPNPNDVRELTILFYAAGDESDIEMPTTEGIKLFEKSKALHKNKNVSVFVLHDRTGDNKGTPSVFALDYVEPDARTADKVDSPSIDENEIAKALGIPKFTYPEWDSGNPVTLKNFIRMGVRLRPARHYLLYFAGHSWGQAGLMQDFFVDGKKLQTSTLIKNYEVRRVLKEIYQENRDYIPLGKFDAIMLDACTWGQLDVFLEVADEVNYLGASALETPYRSIPYNEVLDAFVPQLDKLVADRPQTFDTATENEKFNAVFEKYFLKNAIEKYIKAHAPGGSLVEKEGEVDSVQYFAVRTAGLKRVKAALTNFVAKTPKEVVDAWRAGKLPWADRIIDIDTNVDLVQFAREFRNFYDKRAQVKPAVWQAALGAAKELEESLGNRAPDPSIEPTLLKHETAEGAWVSVDIDAFGPRNMAVCMALQAYTMLRFENTLDVPTLKRGKEKVGISDFKCPDYAPDKNAARIKTKKKLAQLKKAADLARAGKPFAFPEMWDFKLEWKHGVDVYLTETKDDVKRDDEMPKLSRRVLSIWVPKSGEKLNKQAVFRFAGTTEINVDYLLEGDPVAYLTEGKGKGQKAKTQTVPAYTLSLKDEEFTIDGKPGLFVAEGHSNHAFFKHGLGIVFAPDLKGFEPYLNGRLPLETVEAMEKKTMTMQDYEKFFEEKKAKGEEKNYFRTGNAFYRLHRINDTGWPKFIGLEE